MLKFISRKDLNKLSKIDSTKYWDNSKEKDLRFDYMQKAIDIIKKIGVKQAYQVLEIGSNGATVVKGAHILDKFHRETYSKKPKYIHNATEFPYPIKDKKYKLVMALRVFHHLIPYQKKAFLECKRIAKNLIIVMPYRTKPENKSVHVIPLEKFIEWNKDTPPTVMQKTMFGYLYYWSF